MLTAFGFRKLFGLCGVSGGKKTFTIFFYFGKKVVDVFVIFRSARGDVLCVHSQRYTHIYRLTKPPPPTSPPLSQYSTSQIRSFFSGERERGKGEWVDGRSAGVSNPSGEKLKAL